MPNDVITFIKAGQTTVNTSVVSNTQVRTFLAQPSGQFQGAADNLTDRLDEYYVKIYKMSGEYYLEGIHLNVSGGGDASTLNSQNADYYLSYANFSGVAQSTVSGNVAFVAPSGRFTRLDSTNIYATQSIITTEYVTNANLTTVNYSEAYPSVNNWSTQGNGVTIPWNTNHVQNLPISGNVALTFTAPDGPARLQLIITQDAVGSRVPTWPATVKWPGGVAPTLTTTASGIDVIAFWYNGTNYLGTSALDFR